MSGNRRAARVAASGIDVALVTVTMLLFEFFPAFVAIVCVVAGVSLFMMNLEADNEDKEREDHSAS